MKSFVMAAVAGLVLVASSSAGEKSAPAQAPVKPVAKAEPKTVLVPTTVYKKETVMVPKTVVKKETVLVPVKVAECCTSCDCAVAARRPLFDGRLRGRVRGATARVVDCVSCK